MTRPLALGAAATAAMALLAGCGSSSSSSTTAASTAAATPTQSTTTTTTATATATAGQGLTVETKHDKLGTILAAGPRKLTVYLFEADKGARSACSGACAKVWPPVTTKGVTGIAGAAVGSDVATVKRSDGSEQVTYKGHPLYYFAKDGDAGDAYGQGSTQFGAGWYVLKPNGEKLDSDDPGDDDSASSSGPSSSATTSSSSDSMATTSTSSSGGYKY